MNKNEFVKKLSFELNLSQNLCNKIIKKQYEILRRELITGGEVNFKNLGRVFVSVKREKILKINNKEYLIPQKSEPKIKLYKNFKNIVK